MKSRRQLLQTGTAALGLSACGRKEERGAALTQRLNAQPMFKLLAELKNGKLRAGTWLKSCLAAIAQNNTRGPELRAVIELHRSPDRLLETLARGDLQGAPFLIKDNIETADGLLTTAGSLALLKAPAPQRDAFVVQRLRAAGALIFGKTNLSEWANIRSHHSISGWSARGGLTRNPHHPSHTASGSSSGSAAAVAAGFCAAALGTETNGSIVSPASACGIVGLKPTLGSVSRSGIIPITHWQDTAGAMTRTVRDAALIMEIIAAHDPTDPMSVPRHERPIQSYLQHFGPDALKGRRLGIVRSLCGNHPEVLKTFEDTVLQLKAAGAEVVDEVELPQAEEAAAWAWRAMLTEFRQDLNRYLKGRGGEIQSLAELIVFNKAHREQEMPHFGQELFEIAEARQSPADIEKAKAARALAKRLAGPEGIDSALQSHDLDALICPTNDPAGQLDLSTGDANTRVASSPAAVAGYPHLTLPMGHAEEMPIGFSFIGKAWSEPLLLAMGDALEAKLRFQG